MSKNERASDFEIVMTEGAKQPGGYVAQFTFADGTHLEILIPGAVAGGGHADDSITEARWQLRCKKDVVLGGRLTLGARRENQPE